MKVLHLIKTPIGATWAVRQILSLVLAGIEVHVAIPDGPRAADLERGGAHVHRVGTDVSPSSPRSLIERPRVVRRLVDRIRPDLIHSHFVGTTLAARFGLRGLAKPARIFQVPGPLHLEHGILARSEIRTASERDYWIATCKWTQERYLSLGVPPDRVFLSYYGSDIAAAPTRRTGLLRRDLGVGPHTPLIGMVAYMYPPKRYLGQRTGLKGHEDLIGAAAILKDRGYIFKLVFIGGPWKGADWYERRIVALAAKRLGDRAIFTGTREDVGSIYPDLDIAVHPSHSENLGGSVESLLAGVPTVATNVGGFPDLVVDGATGRLVNANSPSELADAIAWLLEYPHEARTMAIRGQLKARSMFDLAITAAETAQIYRAVLDATAG